jgi:hypothetical protein
MVRKVTVTLINQAATEVLKLSEHLSPASSARALRSRLRIALPTRSRAARRILLFSRTRSNGLIQLLALCVLRDRAVPVPHHL